MAHLIEADTIGKAWRAALARLTAVGGAEFDLMVAIDPSQEELGTAELETLGAFLARRGWHSVETVANTIFPAAMAATAADRDTLYRRYQRVAPILHRIPANWKGIYFERLIDYPLQERDDRRNQLELVICDLINQLRRPGPLGHAYELQIFAPGQDRLPRGFPCMSSISIHLDERRLRLAATYRNQYYVQKALGNLLGLARLQHWIARQVGIEVGGLSMHAYHAQIDPGVSSTDTAALLRASAA